MQNHLNLLYREEEREMLPLCLDQGVGVTPWSPLARGRLARAWEQETERSVADAWGRGLYASRDDDHAIVDRVGEVAGQTGAARSGIALAWLLQKREVTAPVVGIARPIHLTDALAAMDLVLTPEHVRFLEEPYQSHAPAGFA